MKRVLLLGVAGLATTVENFRARAFMENVREKINGHGGYQCETHYLTYDTIFVDVFLAIIAGYDIIILIGHSFGGGAIKWIADQLSVLTNPPIIHLVLALDPAPNVDRFHQFFNWALANQFDWARWRWPENVVQKALTFHQTNGADVAVIGSGANLKTLDVLGVCGVPFHELDGRFRNIEVGKWGLSHSNMVESPDVQHLMYKAIFEIALPDLLFPELDTTERPISFGGNNG